MKLLPLSVAVLGLLSVVVTGCGSPASIQVLCRPVGPAPGISSSGSSIGELQVYSATEPREESGLYYYPHSSYVILDTEGNKVRFVPNHLGYYDETPSVVSIAAGVYRIHARADGYGKVEIPVVVESGKMTPVYLQRSRKRRPMPDGSSAVVCMPDGRSVGWSACLSTAP